jgi:hypothetical protein
MSFLQQFLAFHGHVPHLRLRHRDMINNNKVHFRRPKVKYREYALWVESAFSNRDNDSLLLLFHCAFESSRSISIIFVGGPFVRRQNHRLGEAVRAINHKFHLAGNGVVIDWRAQDKSISMLEHLIDLINPVLIDATCTILNFSRLTRLNIQVVQIDFINQGARIPTPIQYSLDECICVHAFSWAPDYTNDSNLLHLKIPFCNTGENMICDIPKKSPVYSTPSST